MFKFVAKLMKPSENPPLFWDDPDYDEDTPIYNELLEMAKNYGWAYPGSNLKI